MVTTTDLCLSLEDSLQKIVELQHQGQLEKAIELSQQLLAEHPDYNPLFQNIGLMFLHCKQPEKALEYLIQAIKSQPEEATHYSYAGVALCQLGRVVEGIEYYKKALDYNATYAEVLLNLGLAYIELNDLVQAEAHLKQALAAKFPSPVLYYNLGYLEHQKKQLAPAIDFYQKGLELEPRYVKCAINLAEALFEADRMEEANRIFSQLAKIFPEDKKIHKKLGATCLKLKKFEEAVEHLEKGFDPNEEDSIFYLTSAYSWVKKLEKLYETWLIGFRHFPNNPTILMSLINICRAESRWEYLDELIIQLKKLIHNDEYLFTYPLYYILGLNLEEEMLFARKIANYYKGKLTQDLLECNFQFKRTSKKKLKIGYLSGNIRNHPNAHMIQGMFTNHSRDGFEFYLYATEKADSSKYANVLMKTPDHFVDLTDKHPIDAAQIIYDDDIDILVDLSGYHRKLSSQILVLRPAPLVVGYLGHCGTRGSDYLDYIVSDTTVTLPEELQYYDEKIIFLPNTHYITNDQQEIADYNTRSTFNFPEDKFIFTCFNLNIKYEPSTFFSWMRILQQVPNSVLLLWTREGRENLQRYAVQHGIDPDRIIFAESLEKSVHLARLRQLDLFIDSFDCSAHCTAIDALWSGLPIVTLYGQNVAQRGCSSILKAHGMDELITYSIAEYEAKVIELATNPELLAATRARITANKATHPLFNTKQFTTHLEVAYKKIYERYLVEKAPDHLFL